MTDQQKAELRGRGFEIWHGCLMLDPRSLLDPGNDEDRLYLQRIAEAATILGIQIPGCRQVPEDVDDSLLLAVAKVKREGQYHDVSGIGPTPEWRMAVEEAIAALASALSPKEVPER